MDLRKNTLGRIQQVDAVGIEPPGGIDDIQVLAREEGSGHAGGDLTKRQCRVRV